MKRWERFIVLGLCCWIPFSGKAQCETELRMLTYDSTFYGTGNGFYNFSFPKFDVSLGTLVGVEFQSVVTIKYGFTLENWESNTTNYRVRLFRDDEFSSEFLQDPLLHSTTKNFGPYSLGPYDYNPGMGSDYKTVGPLIVMDKDTIVRTAFNTADYLGEGMVNMDYSTFTYSTTMGSVNNQKIESAIDTMQVRIIYLYCYTSLLPADFTGFNAIRKQDQVLLNWEVENDEAGRRYEVQYSTDGRNYQTFRNMPSRPGNNQTGRYTTDYTLQPQDAGKLVFRIRQTDADGLVKYSQIRVVDLGKNPFNRLKVYPNPATDKVSILFSNHIRGIWQVDITTMDGRVIDRFSFNQKLLANIPLTEKYRKGMYLVRARNKETGESFTERLVVQ